MIYLLFFLLSSFFLWLSTKISHRVLRILFFSISVIILVLLATFRDKTVGIDVNVYVYPYAQKAIFSTSFSSYINETVGSGLEIGYAILNYIGAKYFYGLFGVFFLTSLFQLLPIYLRLYELKYEIPIFLSSSIYLFLFYNLSLNLNRQAIALSIIFWGTRYLNKNKVKFLIVVFIAMLFHNSAILSVLIYAIWWGSTGKHSRSKMPLIVFILFMFLGFYREILTGLIPIIFRNPDKYLDAFLPNETGYLSTWQIVYKLFNVFLAYFFKHKFRRKKIINFVFYISIFDLMMYFLTAYNGNSFRFSLYFSLLIPMYVTGLANLVRKEDRWFYYLFVYSIFLSNWFIVNYITDAYGTINYILSI